MPLVLLLSERIINRLLRSRLTGSKVKGSRRSSLFVFALMVKLVLVALSPTLLGADSISTSDLTPTAVLAWYHKSQKTLNLKAEYVVLQAEKNLIPYVWRRAYDPETGSEFEQLNELNGPGFEQIRHNQIISHFVPGRPAYSASHEQLDNPMPLELFNHLEQIKKGYELTLIGRARVAGRPVQKVRVSSKDQTRYHLQIWLDEESGFPLRMLYSDGQGESLKQIQVTSLQVEDSRQGGEISQFFNRLDLESLPSLNQASLLNEVSTDKVTQQQPVQLTFLPKGMQVINDQMTSLPEHPLPVRHLLLHDGLLYVSIYLIPESIQTNLNYVLSNSLSNLVSANKRGKQIVVIGDIPQQTAAKLALGLDWNDSHD